MEVARSRMPHSILWCADPRLRVGDKGDYAAVEIDARI